MLRGRCFTRHTLRISRTVNFNYRCYSTALQSNERKYHESTQRSSLLWLTPLLLGSVYLSEKQLFADDKKKSQKQKEKEKDKKKVKPLPPPNLLDTIIPNTPVPEPLPTDIPDDVPVDIYDDNVAQKLNSIKTRLALYDDVAIKIRARNKVLRRKMAQSEDQGIDSTYTKIDNKNHAVVKDDHNSPPSQIKMPLPPTNQSNFPGSYPDRSGEEEERLEEPAEAWLTGHTHPVGTFKQKLEYEQLNIELIKLQKWVAENRKRVLIIVEGRDTAGKGGAIRNFIFHLDPKHYRVVALMKPTPVEQGQWYFQRYLKELPVPGEIVFFDRSWYNRAIIEPVMGWCSEEQYKKFMRDVVQAEEMLTQDGMIIIKFWFSITKEVQLDRLRARANDPLKYWKLSPSDYRSNMMFDQITKFKEQAFNLTGTHMNPWVIVNGNDKNLARMEALRYLLAAIPYSGQSSAQVSLSVNPAIIHAFAVDAPKLSSFKSVPGFEHVMGVVLHSDQA